MYNAIVFDLDGTLTRSEEGIINSAIYALEKLGVTPPSRKEMLRFIGPPLIYSFKTFIGLDDAQASLAQDFYRERYVPVGYLENEVYTGIPMLLRALKRQGAYLAIATGKPQKPTENILKHFGLAHFFDAVVGTGEKVATSDKKELILKALEGFQGGSAVMVGDRHFDIGGANEVGIDSVGVGYGYGKEQELREAGCTYYAPTVGALRDMLLPNVEADKGIFLSVEGLDGSGKTTQVDMLEQNLIQCGFDVVRTREPGGCPISEKIRKVVLDKDNVEMADMTEALLYAASRAQHVAEVIRPAVKAGKLLLCDRFVDSSITYQGGGRQLGIDTVAAINAYAVDGMYPDATVYLDIGHKEALARRVQASDPDRIERAAEAFHGRVEEAYKALIQKNQDRYLIVDARGDKQSIADDCLKKVLARLNQF